MHCDPLIAHLIKKELNLSEDSCYTEVLVAIKTILSENKKFRSRAIAADERANKLEIEIKFIKSLSNDIIQGYKDYVSDDINNIRKSRNGEYYK